MKLTKDFRGVPNGAFYPVYYAKGDECPKELEEAAREAGALPAKTSKPPKNDGNTVANEQSQSNPPAENSQNGDKNDESNAEPLENANGNEQGENSNDNTE